MDITGTRKSLPVYRNGKILKTFTFQELINIDNLNGEFKRHIRRTKAEIEADRKKPEENVNKTDLKHPFADKNFVSFDAKAYDQKTILYLNN